MDFYERNYIEGLFLSSAIPVSPDDTMERMLAVVRTLRKRERFGGYIHLKAIPGADLALVREAGLYVDRMSVNIELPSEVSLRRLAPEKTKQDIIRPMSFIGKAILENRGERQSGFRPPSFVPAGQSTQVIIGASPDTDHQILRLSEGLYRSYGLKRVYYSAYVPVNEDSRLPALSTPPLLREHRLYQADWLVRLYGFQASEILSDPEDNLDTELDPKSAWALRHPAFFPVEVNRDAYERLLRVPGVGLTSAQRIVAARRFGPLSFDDLKRIGVVLRRARYFLTCGGHYLKGLGFPAMQVRRLLLEGPRSGEPGTPRQMELFDAKA
jgi:putative DNA modification/repair radical SAM protein